MNDMMHRMGRQASFLMRRMKIEVRYLLKRDVPNAVEIETLAACNRKCAYCPVSLAPARNGVMEFGLYHKIVEDLCEIKYRNPIQFHFYNEPLLDHRLELFVSYASLKLPKCKINIYTNGDLLTKERVYSLFSSGSDMIRISHHDAKSESRISRLMEELDEQTCSKIVRVRYYGHDGPLTNRAGLVTLPKEQAMIDRRAGCSWVNMLVVNCDGEVPLCCNDFHVVNGFGSLKHNSVKEIWTHSRRLRKEINSGKYDLEICLACDTNTGEAGSPA